MSNQVTRCSISSSVFGQLPEMIPVYEYTLENGSGMKAKILSYGGIIRECWVPNEKGTIENVVLGFDKLAPYLAKHPRFGSTIGRYANRIAGAEFELDGITYKLVANNGPNCIHGGLKGFDKQIWQAVDKGENEREAWVTLQYLSKDMEEGFPGDLEISIKFAVTADNGLQISYNATTNKATPINFTNHSYFNLSGAGNGDILAHLARFNASNYTELNAESIPTGKILPVDRTAFDFRKETPIGTNLRRIDGGFDINYVVDQVSKNGEPQKMQQIAVIKDPQSGRSLTVFTDQPGFQFFTANGLNGSIQGNGGPYIKHAGLCIETQHFADSVHHPNFPNTILRPGEEFKSSTLYLFGP